MCFVLGSYFAVWRTCGKNSDLPLGADPSNCSATSIAYFRTFYTDNDLCCTDSEYQDDTQSSLYRVCLCANDYCGALVSSTAAQSTTERQSTVASTQGVTPSLAAIVGLPVMGCVIIILAFIVVMMCIKKA